MRPILILLHRYVGLALASFLIIIGLTGSIIAFYEPLEHAINPNLHFVTPQKKRIDPLVMREALEKQDPNSHVYYVHFPHKADESASMYVEGAIDPQTGEEKTTGYDELFANPYTGARLGERQWGDFTPERKNAMTMLYFLHYSLVLPEELGEGFMGIIALIWVFDCFVGFALTLPKTRVDIGSQGNHKKSSKKAFWSRWKPAWLIKTNAGSARVVYDTHRALSLWVWLVLLMFAWSGFAFNLPTPYHAIMNKIVKTTNIDVRPELEIPLVNPKISWFEARKLGEQYMQQTAAKYGFEVKYPTVLVYRRDKGFYYYGVMSSADVVNFGATGVAIDAQSGALIGEQVPTGAEAGTTFTSWISALHIAAWGGMPWRIFVSFMGLVVVALSATGIWLWWRKKLGRSTPEAA